MKNKIFKILLLVLLLCNITPVLALSSSNKDLSVLSVDDHEIYFHKERTKYKIVIEKGENELHITAIPEDSKAKVEITGADDLKANNYKVVVKVTAENKSTKEYIIEAEEKKEIKEIKSDNIVDQIANWYNSLGIDNSIYIGIGVLILGFIIIVAVIKKVKDKKIDKTMDKF